MQLSLELLRLKRTASMVPIETKQPESSNQIAPSSPVQGCRDFVLPDLNEPAMDLWRQGFADSFDNPDCA